MWLHHFFSFLGSVISIFVSAIGTTVLGLLIGVVLPLLTMVFTAYEEIHRGGRQALNSWRTHGKKVIKDTLVRVAFVYIPILLWSLGRAVYMDHLGLVKGSRAQLAIIAQDDKGLRIAREGLTRQISEWKENCAHLQGANDVLTRQNTDQQNTINNCQTQALKLLAPEPLKLVPLMLDRATGGVELQHVKVLLLINKLITPVDLMVKCQRRFVGLTASILGSSGLSSGGEDELTDNLYEVKISTPAWGPDTPMVLDMSYIGDANNTCNFTPR